MSGAVADFHSLGPVTAARLAEIGIDTQAALIEAGAVGTYRRLKFRFGRAVTLNALYGLDAAIRNVHWRTIDEERTAELRRLAEGA